MQRSRCFDDGEWARTWNGLIILARRRNNLLRHLLWCEGTRLYFDQVAVLNQLGAAMPALAAVAV